MAIAEDIVLHLTELNLLKDIQEGT